MLFLDFGISVAFAANVPLQIDSKRKVVMYVPYLSSQQDIKDHRAHEHQRFAKIFDNQSWSLLPARGACLVVKFWDKSKMISLHVIPKFGTRPPLVPIF